MNYTIDLQEIADELEFDLEDVEMVLGVFMEDSVVNLNNMKIAIRAGNLDDVKLSAHAIKGSALNLLLNDVGSLATEIEENAAKSEDVDYLALYTRLNDLVIGLRDE